MVSDKRCHHVQDALAVLKFGESSLYPLFRQDDHVCLARKHFSRHRLLDLILKLMKLCASRSAELQLEDAASVFYEYLFRMFEKVYTVEKRVAGDVSTFVDVRETIVKFTDSRLAMSRAYNNFHARYIVSTKEVAPLLPNHSILTAFVFLQNIGRIQGNYRNSENERKYSKRTISCGNDQNPEDKQLLNIEKVCLVTLTNSLKSSKSGILAGLQLLSQIAEDSVENLPHFSTTLSGFVSLVSSTMASTSKFILRIIKGLVKQHNLDCEQLYELTELLKVALFSFNKFANIVKKICPDVFHKSTKLLERTATDIGTTGRQLAQCKLYRRALGLLAPLWPFPRMTELVQYVKHHETLCESYMSTGRIEEAWYVACKAVTVDLGFMSHRLVKVFVHILEKHTSIFSQTECVKLLKKSMDATSEHHLFNDISSHGSLLYYEIRTFIYSKITCGALMQKAVHFFNKWMKWYSFVGSDILTPEETPRASLSISFLRKIADTAIIYFKNLTAVKALTEAYSLAHKMKLWDTVRDLMLTIVTLMPQLGLQLETDNPCNSPEMTDIFLEAISLENNDDLLRLVAIASYHLNTGQFQKFLLVCDAVYHQISLASQRGDDPVTITFAQGVIEKLEAEFLMMPGARKMMEENAGCTEPVQTALDKIRSSNRHFESISHSQLCCLLLKNKVGSNVVQPWQFVHQRLQSVKLAAELCLFSGLSLDAKNYLTYGLMAVNRVILYTWEAIFYSRLTELVLISNDLDSAIYLIQRTQKLVFCKRPILESGSGTCYGEFKAGSEPSDNLACKMSSMEKENSSLSCQNKKESRQSQLDSLLGAFGLDRLNVTNQKPLQECFTLTDIDNACCSCQSEMIGVCISLMAHQAEILWRKKKSICAVISLLQLSMDMSHRFLSRPPCTSVINCMVESGWKFCQSKKVSSKVLAETAYKCAEVYAHSLFIKSTDSHTVCDHVQPTVDNILGLLETAETVGKNVGEFHLRNTIVASALLLRSQLKYLTILEKLPHDDGQDVEIISSNLCSPAIMETIYSVVHRTTNNTKEWDYKRHQMLNFVKEDSNTSESGKSMGTEQTNCFSNLLPSHLLSVLPTSDHQAKNVVDESSLKSCCTVGAASKNTTVSKVKQASDSSTISKKTNGPNNSATTSTKDVLESSCQTGNDCIEAKEKPDFNCNTKEGTHFSLFIEDGKPAWMEQLTGYFPTVTACQNGAQRMSYLQTALQQLQEVPHFWLYRQTCQSIALCLWEQQMIDVWAGSGASSRQTEIAAYLTESMHVTFQHQMAHNFSYKLSRNNLWEDGSQEEAQTDKQAMKEALNVLRFGKDVKEKFQNRLALLPADWTVVQMTIVNFDPENLARGQIFVTRLQHDREPLTVGLPVHRCQFLSNAQRAYEEVMVKCHFECLRDKSEHLRNIMRYLQEVFLAGHKWLLQGQLAYVRQAPVQTFLDEEGRRAVYTILQKHGYPISYMELRNFLEILIIANEADVLSMVESMWPQHVAKTVAGICLDVQWKVNKMCGGQWSYETGPVILILDNKLVCFPWESMLDLMYKTVTRIPSLASLTALWTLHTGMTKSPFTSGVQRDMVTANIDDFVETDEILIFEGIAAILKQYQDWHVRTERIHKCAEKLEPVLKNSSLYIFIGHGWSDYNILENIFGRAFTFLMCCCGGMLHAKGKLDGDGAPLYFLLAGSPAVMGNLWMVVEDHCTLMASEVFSYWMTQKQPISLAELVVWARQASWRNQFHTSGLVTYGLPVILI